jgi:hypothetical protein
MFARIRTRVRLHPYSTAARLAVAALLVILVAGRAVDEVGLLAFTAHLDSLEVPPSGDTLTTSEWSFAFQDTECFVSVGISEDAVSCAEQVPTSDVFSSRGRVRQRYVRRLVDALAQGDVVRQVLDDLRAARDRLELDSDEYLELMVHAVQAIPYGTVDADIELLAEMLAEGSGVCTEKSLLLAAMMVREGYDTVLWVFDAQHHVALGVAGESARFRGSEYTFIETTATRYIGQAEAKYTGYAAYVQPPALIRLGGKRSYGATREVEFLLRQLRLAEQDRAFGERYAAHAARASGSQREEYARRAEEHLAATRVESFIISNAHDRVGAYKALVYDSPLLRTP